MITEKDIRSAKKCGDIFTNDKNIAKAEYRELARRYHPDIHSGNGELMTKINSLYQRAMSLFENGNGNWEASDQVSLVSSAGEILVFSYLAKKSFELGVLYICETEVVYVLDASHEKYFQNAKGKIGSLQYANDAMKNEVGRYMPKIKRTNRLKDGRWCIVFHKAEDFYSLEDLVKYFGGAVPPKHAAWMISRLCNICCYLDYLGLAHNGIGMGNCFVSPKTHVIALLGGWWYCAEQEKSMMGTQKAIYDVMPPKEKSQKLATIVTDLESVKLIGRQILGNVSLFASAKNDANIPEAILKFLRSGSSERAVDEFEKWNGALIEAFGRPRFIELNIEKSDIYK